MDSLFREYYKYMNVEYDFYDSFYHFVDYKMHKNKEFKQINLEWHLGSNTYYRDYSYLLFHTKFPFLANLGQNKLSGDQRKRAIFEILRICYLYIKNALISLDIEMLRDELIVLHNVNHLIFFLNEKHRKIHYESSKILSNKLYCCASKEHEIILNLIQFNTLKAVDTRQLLLSKNMDIEYAYNLITLAEQRVEWDGFIEKVDEIAEDLKLSRKDRMLLTDTEFIVTNFEARRKDDSLEQELRWSHVIQIVGHNFDIKWANKLKQILLKMMTDYDHYKYEWGKLHKCQKALSVGNEEWQVIKRVIDDYNAIQYPISVQTISTGAHSNILRDVYSVYKAFIEENNKTETFSPNDFYKMVESKALLPLPEFAEKYLDFYYRTIRLAPIYIIDDDLFEIKDLIIKITDFINSIRCKYDEFHFNFFIIPQRVEKVIDCECVFEYVFDESFLKNECADFSEEYFNFIIDRRSKSNKIYATQSPVDYSFFISYLLIFEFILSADNVLKCYLNYGINERMRFYPQFIVDILPKLFKKAKYENASNYYSEYIQRIYRRDFKNSWSVDLYDPSFNQTYKKITGYDHVSINYDREKTNFVDPAQKQYEHQNESDEKYADDKECDENTDLNHCKYVNYLIKILNATKVSKSGNIIHSANYSKISAAFDHLIRSHSLFHGDNLKSIQSHFASKCGGFCAHGNKCKNLTNHILTKREAIKEKMDSLFAYLKNKEFEEWIIANDYDSDCIQFDIEHGKASFILNIVCSEKEFQIVQKYMSKNEISKDELFGRLFNMIHVYLLHDQHELYRLRGIENNRFGSKVIEEKNKGFAEVNFGKSVLEWLPFGEKPTFLSFKEEMINNPQSTVNADQYESFEEECKVKQENASINAERYCLNELVAMKIYCDTNEYQAALRKAFWDIPRNKEYEQMKKNFYRWATTLYEVFLYAAAPPNRLKKTSTAPVTLYHGLNQLLILNDDLPQYNGIFSTSKGINVAHSFSKARGLLWKINGSYTNRFNFIKGIDMQWISCHPNEAEFALFNQHIPIKSTTNFAQSDDEKIDILMQQLLTFEKEITSSKKFCQQIGIQLQKAWWEKILVHPLLYKKVPHTGMQVIERLLQVFDSIQTLETAIKNSKKGETIIHTGPMCVCSLQRLTECLQIKCNGTLIIAKHGCVDGDIGLHGDSGVGGALVEIIADKIINSGKITCCGFQSSRGGSIRMIAKTIENYGKILAYSEYGEGDGRIEIYYQDQFVDNGTIAPNPFVHHVKYDENKQLTPAFSRPRSGRIWNNLEQLPI